MTTFINGFISSWEDELNDASERLNLLKKTHQLIYAYGDDLDRIGAFFRIDRRAGEEDEVYRKRLLSYVNSFEGGGTRQSFINVFDLTYNVEVIVDDVVPIPTAQILLNLLDMGGSSLGIDTNEIELILNQTKAAGINATYGYYVPAGDITDKFIITDFVEYTSGVWSYMTWDINNWDEAFWAPTVGYGIGYYDLDAYDQCLYG